MTAPWRYAAGEPFGSEASRCLVRGGGGEAKMCASSAPNDLAIGHDADAVGHLHDEIG
jgi:hypothetical protein